MFPPTRIDYANWAKPIKGLFDILNTFPGYREIDLSSFFMVAMPIFAAMLIGDTGYGLIFALPTFIWYDKMVKAAGKEATNLLRIVGIATIVWGVPHRQFLWYNTRKRSLWPVGMSPNRAYPILTPCVKAPVWVWLSPNS